MPLQVMAVLNATPDSFSDGGRSIEALVTAAGEALALGATILDVGGESTRPGADAVPVDEELRRILPVITALHQAYPQALISVDTRKADVARQALQAGAGMINDVSGLCFDPAMADVAAETGAALVIMHAQGLPATMQHAPHYDDVVAEVGMFLARQAERAQAAGVAREKIWVDPGFGFGKTLTHNLALMRHLPALRALGYPVLVGTSRKSFLTLGTSIPPRDREALTAASVAFALQAGVAGLRLHDLATQMPVIRWVEAVLATEQNNRASLTTGSEE